MLRNTECQMVASQKRLVAHSYPTSGLSQKHLDSTPSVVEVSKVLRSAINSSSLGSRFVLAEVAGFMSSKTPIAGIVNLTCLTLYCHLLNQMDKQTIHHSIEA